ncbi:hypothetical protein K438DRAFT_1970081 [Mycena galopus ATCC 62051]|nr:hypothetical protein K438DRAFT_1970081 [Mycena galopus ATCC 62051]
MALAGKAAGKDVGMWFSPTVGAGAFRWVLCLIYSAFVLLPVISLAPFLSSARRHRRRVFFIIILLRRHTGRRPVLSSPSLLSLHTGTTPTSRHTRMSDARGGSLSPELVYAPGGSMSQLDFGYTAQRVGYPYQDS